MRFCSAALTVFGKLLQRLRKRAVLRLLIGQRLHLHQHLLQQVLRRHPSVVDAALHVRRDLREGLRHLLQPRDVVVVVLHGIELQVDRHLRQIGVEAVELVDRHLPLFELRRLLVVDQRAHHQLGRELLLIRQAGRVDHAEPLDVSAPARQRGIDRLHGVVGQLIVVALVAEIGGVLRRVLQLVLPDLVKQRVQRLAAVCD